MSLLRIASTLALAALLTPAVAQVQHREEPGMTYDVVSVKPNNTGSGNTDVDINNDVYEAKNVSVKLLIQAAYGLISRDQILQLPPWASSANFDVMAKLTAEDVAKMKNFSREESEAQRQLLMQALLADRFQLKIHREQRDLPVYALIIARGGIKFPVSDAKNPKAGGFSVHNQELDAYGVPVSSLAYHLSPRVHRVVLDKTGLTGLYDFTMKWRRDDLAPGQDGTAAEALPTLFDALQEQLGLKLESAKGPVDMVVVDHIAQPTAD